MERSGYKIIPILLLCFSLNAGANYKTEIYSAYVNNNMAKWKGIIDTMEAEKNRNNDFLAELVNYQYGYIAWCIGNKKNDEAKKYLDLAEKNISIMEEDIKNLSLVNSYKSAFYGYKIGLNLLLAPFLGNKSVDCAKLAIDLDKENPLGYVQYANIQYYMPALFGGSKKEAIGYYLKAEKLMEKNMNEMTENWNYLNLLVIIAQTYSYLDEFQSSISYYEKILIIEPVFGYVKNELYPEVLKKIKK
jgi:tetratricopeptide (TPR) repeat protein